MKKRALVLSDGKMGHQNQSIGLVEYLNLEYDILKLKRRSYVKLIALLFPSVIIKNLKKLKKIAFDYDVVVGIGSLPHFALVVLKKINPSIKTICIMDPKRNYDYYDVMAIPNHDKLTITAKQQANVVSFTGSLSYFKQDDLDLAKEDFKQEFKSFSKNSIVGLIVGGDSRGYDFGLDKAKLLVENTKKLAKKTNSNIYATTSRRTSTKQALYIKKNLEDDVSVVYTLDGKNPYRAIMAYSNIIIVTPETVSMLTEAAATKSLVLVFDKDSVKSKRVKLFIDELLEKEYIFDFEEVCNSNDIESYIEKSKNKRDFKSYEKIAEFIKRREII